MMPTAVVSDSSFDAFEHGIVRGGTMMMYVSLRGLRARDASEGTAMDYRFEVMLDPCDQWIVWDTVEDMPASWSGVFLMALAEPEATAFATLLNQIPAPRALLAEAAA